jgi:hypothetical protein
MDEPLRARLAPFYGAMSDFAAGTVVDVGWDRQRGLSVAVDGVERARLAGADVARLVFSIWLGERCVDDELRQGLLGGG